MIFTLSLVPSVAIASEFDDDNSAYGNTVPTIDGLSNSNCDWRYSHSSDFTEKELLYIVGNFTFPYVFDDYIIYVDEGNKIMRSDLSEANIIYTDINPGEITYFVAEPDMAFYLKGDSLYRIVFSTGVSSFICELPGVINITPISYDEILWTRVEICDVDEDHAEHEKNYESFYINISPIGTRSTEKSKIITVDMVTTDEYFALNGAERIEQIL